MNISDAQNEFLNPVQPKNLYAYYLQYMVNLEDPRYDRYKLYPGIQRTSDVQKAEVADILGTGSRVAELESNILMFAQDEIGLKPASVFFPDARLQYAKICDCLSNVTNNWVNYVQIVNAQLAMAEQISADPALAKEFSDRLRVNNEIFELLANKMKTVASSISVLEAQ